MSTSSKMNSADNLSIIHPDDTEHPTTPVSNMPFDESIEFRTSDCISPEAIDKINELLEISRLEREDMDAYDLTFQSKNFNEYSNLDTNLPPIPPAKDEDDIEKKMYKGKFYADAMEMEEAMREDAIWSEFSEKNIKNIIDNNKFNVLKDSLGDGKFEYIKDLYNREMLVNAWQAITQTNNWDFVAQEIDSFMFSNDTRIYEISMKMEELGYNGHSGCSFGCTMRNMQYLAQKGEQEFKKLFRLDELESTI